MKLNDLLELIHKSFPEEHTRLCWDDKKQKVRTGTGDTLAEFVVSEIADTFDEAAPDEKQRDEALSAMRWACTELEAVMRALEAAQEADKTRLGGKAVS
jgi:hypothetical protein